MMLTTRKVNKKIGKKQYKTCLFFVNNNKQSRRVFPIKLIINIRKVLLTWFSTGFQHFFNNKKEAEN